MFTFIKRVVTPIAGLACSYVASKFIFDWSVDIWFSIGVTFAIVYHLRWVDRNNLVNGQQQEQKMELSKICYYISDIREKLQKQLNEDVLLNTELPHLKSLHNFTSKIPRLTSLPEIFKRKYFPYLVDECLENEEINNFSTSSDLYPLWTPIDGNSLCHSVSMYMWGIPDHLHFLRQLVYVSMVTDNNQTFKRYYLMHTVNMMPFAAENQCSLGFQNTWEELLSKTSEQSVNPHSSNCYPLEAIHIFVLCNILRRPIIVLSPSKDKSMTDQRNSMNGIYLPLLRISENCQKSPIVISYNMNHFSALKYEISSLNEKNGIFLNPRTSEALHVRFVRNQSSEYIDEILGKYLIIQVKDVQKIALIEERSLPDELDAFKDHLESFQTTYFASASLNQLNVSEGRQQVSQSEKLQQLELSDRHYDTMHFIALEEKTGPKPCINNCGMYGAASNGYRCSQCFLKYTQSIGQHTSTPGISTFESLRYHTEEPKELLNKSYGVSEKRGIAAAAAAAAAIAAHFPVPVGQFSPTRRDERMKLFEEHKNSCVRKSEDESFHVISSLCSVAECPNRSAPQYNGLCAECYQRNNIKPLETSKRNLMKKSNKNRFDENRFDENRFDENRFDENRYDERRYDERRYDECRFDERRFDEHAQFSISNKINLEKKNVVTTNSQMYKCVAPTCQILIYSPGKLCNVCNNILLNAKYQEERML